MATDGCLLERLRQQQADLESGQGRSGGTAGAGFWSTLSPDAAEPAPTEVPESGAPDPSGPRFGGDGPQREYPAPLTMHWSNCSHVGGAYASGFAVQHYREVNLVWLVGAPRCGYVMVGARSRGVPPPRSGRMRIMCGTGCTVAPPAWGTWPLLCRRHHVNVHAQGLTATITAAGVTWHTWQHWRTTSTASTTTTSTTSTTSTTDADPGPPRHPTPSAGT